MAKKFLIIRFSSIGDIVLTTTVIRCLKKQVHGSEVHFLTKESFKAVLEANPYIDKLHTLKDDLDGMIAALKVEKYDAVIDLHHNLRSLKVKRALGVKAYAFNKLNIEKWLLTAAKINRLPAVHIVDRYLETVSTFGVANDGAGLDYFIPAHQEVPFSHLPASHHMGFIGLVIGAAHATKRLPANRLAQLCSLIDYPIVLLGGKEDREAGEAISAANPVQIYNACGRFTLNESADLVRNARLIISHDTGLMHIAAAFRKPIISLWGNTVPAFGMTPYYGNAQVRSHMFEVTGLRCRPCSKIGYDTCPRGHFKCMNQINLDQVNALAMQWVASKGS